MEILLLVILLIILVVMLFLLFATALFMAIWFIMGAILAKILVFLGFPPTIDGVSTTLLIGAAFACIGFITNMKSNS